MRSFPQVAFAAHAALVHLLLSLSAAAAVAILVFGVWFPWPHGELTGSHELFWLIVSVDVVCGPLLTLVLYTPIKSKSELQRDMAFVIAIQVLALSYGLHTLALSRPVALVFEVDRFRAVSIADLEQSDLINSPSWLRKWSLSGPKLIGARRPRDKLEILEDIEKSSAGIETGQRPSWWQQFALNVADALSRSKPVSELVIKHPKQRVLIDKAIVKSGQPESSLRWLPLVSHRALDWTALIDAETAVPVGYVHLDGF